MLLLCSPPQFSLSDPSKTDQAKNNFNFDACKTRYYCDVRPPHAVVVRPPQISLRNPSRTDQAAKSFTFDAVYDETTQQKAFYEESCYDLVEGVMEGYNGTIFAYGQVSCPFLFSDVLLLLLLLYVRPTRAMFCGAFD